MNKVLSFIITAKNRTQSGLSAALGGIKSFAKGAFTNLMNIQAGFNILMGAAKKLYSVLDASFKFETTTHQFKTLIGSMDTARDHMKVLQDLGATPPFSLQEFAKASRTMMVMTDNALGFKDSLILVGDAAAATGQPIETLAHEVGRAYAIIRDGQPLSRATMSLKNMGILTPEVAARLDELQKAGASNTEIWGEFTDALEKHKGAMEELNETGEGLVGQISSQWEIAVTEFGDAFNESAKGGMKNFLNRINELNENGNIEKWADNFAQAMQTASDAIVGFGQAIGWLWDKSGASDVWAAWQGIGDQIGTFAGALAGGADVSDAWAQSNRAYNERIISQGYYSRQLARDGSWMMGWTKEDRKIAQEIAQANDDYDEKLRERGRKRRERRQSENYKKEADEKAKVEAQMAEASRKKAEKEEAALADFREKNNAEVEKARLAAESAYIDAELNGQSDVAQKRAQLAAEYASALADVSTKEEKAELDAATALAKSRLDLEQKIEDARNRALEEQAEYEKEMQEARLAELEAERKKRIENVRDELAASQEAEREASSRLSAADSAVAQAWGWYRNKDSMQSAIDDYNAQKEAEKQWAKDFERLKSKNRDWRDVEFGKLSADDEAVRQVALAKEEQQAARKALSEISENTAYLKDIADALSAEGEG